MTTIPARPAAAWRRLLGGGDAVSRWNALSDDDRRAAGDLHAADLTGAALAGVNLGGLDLGGARLGGADLSGAWLLECDLTRAALAGARLDRAWCAEAVFREADLTGASLTRANLRSCDLRRACLAGANLEGATLDGADLCGADLCRATLRGVSVARTRYDGETRFPGPFAPHQLMDWVGDGPVPIAFDVFVRRLAALVDTRRLGRAVEMLKAERFRLYSHVEPAELSGVIKSQTEQQGRVYSCRIDADGRFACCSQDLQPCLGMNNALCKHLIVLMIGLTRAGEADANTVLRWVEASQRHKPKIDPEVMSEPLLLYKAACSGEIDWRPTETIPEDYYAL